LRVGRIYATKTWLPPKSVGTASTLLSVDTDAWPLSFEPGFERVMLTDPQRAFDQDSFQELRSQFPRFAAGR
jgi:hypothetical protein